MTSTHEYFICNSNLLSKTCIAYAQSTRYTQIYRIALDHISTPLVDLTKIFTLEYVLNIRKSSPNIGDWALPELAKVGL